MSFPLSRNEKLLQGARQTGDNFCQGTIFTDNAITQRKISFMLSWAHFLFFHEIMNFSTPTQKKLAPYFVNKKCIFPFSYQISQTIRLLSHQKCSFYYNHSFSLLSHQNNNGKSSLCDSRPTKKYATILPWSMFNFIIIYCH